MIEENMNYFADTSLDCDEFYLFVKSRNFIEIIKNYFCSIRDRMNNLEYVNNIEEYIYKECPSVNHIEARAFVQRIKGIYESYLHRMLMESPKLNATFQLLTISHRDIMSKISESEENMKKYFASLSNTRMQIENEEINAYHEVCKKEYGIIRFTGISGAENKKAQDINKFYVENTFSYYLTKESRDIYRNGSERIELIQLKDFFNIGNKIVLIGGAGLGKSTTLNYLFCNYEKMYGSYSLKIKIDLKEYAKEIGENKKDLLWCIATEFSKKIKRTKMGFEDIERNLAEFLDDGRCLIILDALDEIPTQTVRDRVRNEIASFCEIYYLNRFIISTREAGYLRNRFDDSFLHIKINDFRGGQIKKYSENWFCSYYQKKDFEDFWDKFSQEVKRARCENLIRNPIVLILALVIFDIEKNLPNRRVEFYKKCIETFLTVREDRKGAFILSEKAKNILGIDSVVPKVAFYKYSHITENIGYRFSYEELRNSVFNAIEVEDKLNWGDAVRQYAEYLVDRTELIREIDEDVLDFAHKTFYEYFLAVYFTKEYENKELIDLLQEWIGDSNNDELARLIIEVIIQKDDPKQHKAIMEYLFDRLQSEEINKWDNRTDIFMIITDLYSHNMLQPKFHSRYNKTILFYPRYVERANSRRRRHMEAEETDVRYDSKVLADMFCEETLSNGKFGEVIDSLRYLDDEFNRYVVDQLKEKFITHISELFSVMRNISFREKKKNVKKFKEKNELLLQYFLNEGMESVLKYPQVYTSIIVLIMLEKSEVDISAFFDYQFEENTAFYFYSEPQIFLDIVYEAIENKEKLLLLLILMIHCSKKRTNVLIGYLLDYNDKVKENEGSKHVQIIDFAYYLWKLLNENEDFEIFKNILLEKDLYISEREEIYRTLYLDYRDRELNVTDHRIQEFLEKTSRNNGNILKTEN